MGKLPLGMQCLEWLVYFRKVNDCLYKVCNPADNDYFYSKNSRVPDKEFYRVKRNIICVDQILHLILISMLPNIYVENRGALRICMCFSLLPKRLSKKEVYTL